MAVIEENLYLSEQDIKELLKWKSSQGILSVYAGVKERGKTAAQAWKTMIKSGLNSLQEQHPQNNILKSIVEKAFEEIVNLPQEFRNRSLMYIRTAEGKTFKRSIQLPVETKYAWMDTAFLRPAISILNNAPVMGITILSQESARIMTWRQGLINESEEVRVQLETGLDFEPSSGTGKGQTGGASADRFKHKVEVQINKRLEETASTMAQIAKQHKWEKIILMGSPKFTDKIEENLPAHLQERVVGILDKNYINSSTAKIEEVTSDILINWKRSLEEKQVDDLLELYKSGGRAETGIQKSIDLLAQSRVEHLFFDSALKVTGYKDTNGDYFVDITDEEAEDLEKEAHIIERMVELAYESNAKITPLEGAAAEKLKKYEGVGVILRY